MHRGFVSSAFVALALACPARAHAQETTDSEGRTAWVLGEAGFGFGGGKMGPLYAAASAEAQVWPIADVGLGARYTAFAAGAPDGGGAEDRAVSGLASYRVSLGRMGATPHTRGWLVATLGVGAAHLSGYTGRMKGDGDYDLNAVLISPRVAVLASWRFLAMGGALDFAVVPGHGTAGSVSLVAGATF